MSAHTTLWDRLAAWVYDPFLWLGERLGMARRRRDLLADAEGRVLEIGAGTGLNLRHYRDPVKALVLTEPVEPMARALERRVRLMGRRGGGSSGVGRGASLRRRLVRHGRLDDGALHGPDPALALSEIARVLRPGGRLLFLEHLRSDTERWGRWQDWLERPWAGFGFGCRCNRRTLEVIGAAHYDRESARARWHGMPPLVRPLTIGWAVRERRRSCSPAAASVPSRGSWA